MNRPSRSWLVTSSTTWTPIRFTGSASWRPPTRAAWWWKRPESRRDIPIIPLEDYTGTAREQVKVRTFHRAKGLEFAHADRYPRSRFAHESDDAYRERTELERRILFVALTQARDGLWLGTGPGSG